MVNSKRGEVQIRAGDTVYVLRYGFNALCELQDRTGKTAQEMFEDLQKSPSLRVMRTIFAVGLAERHPDLTEKDAGNILDEIGIVAASEILGKAFAAAFPASGKDEKPADPPKAASTGTAS